MTTLKLKSGKSILVNNGKLLSIISAPSPGQAQTIQSGYGVSISSWTGQPGDIDTFREVLIAGPWSPNLIDGHRVPLLIDRYPDDRGRMDIVTVTDEIVIVKARYSLSDLETIANNPEFLILENLEITLTVPVEEVPI